MGSHAHPSPLVSPRNDQTEQNLRDLLAGLSFDVELRGLAIGHNAAPHSMRYTQLRQSEYKPQGMPASLHNLLSIIAFSNKTSLTCLTY
jgi:hypothetical protein